MFSYTANATNLGPIGGNVSVMVHALDPTVVEGIEVWDGEESQEIWTHANGTLTYEDALTGTTVTRDLTADDCIGDLHIYVTTLEEVPWSLQVSSQGFNDGKSDFNFTTWFFAPSMDGVPDPASPAGEIPEGNFDLVNGAVTVYTAQPGEYKTYGHKTVTVPAEDGSGDIEVKINTVYIVGGFAVKDGEICAKGDYPSAIVVSLVK
ncbi:MAG: hypothetical protein JW800_04985 [Candidatus Omnitrophica bacterium]|nr:hypothetical protein [Candidatus Omnitrophota bacterium]